MRLSKLLCCIKGSIKSAMQQTEKEVTVSAPWGKIAALTWGDPSNPPVILCHGKMDVSSGFRPLVMRLPSCFYYVSVDLPGNGKSDHFPRGARYTSVDFVPTILRLKEHFNFNKFAYIGHSLGVVIGKYFNFVYPGRITRMVELDPVPAHLTWPPTPAGFAEWYQLFYEEFYDADKYKKLNGTAETAPKYSYEKALDLMMKARGLTREASEHVLERSLEPAGDGLYRFNYDQRLKEITRLPFNTDYIQNLYTSVATPTFCVLSQSMIDQGIYNNALFVMDESAWPNNNYKYKIVKGGHDEHINTPEGMADDISKFLLEDFKAKL